MNDKEAVMKQRVCRTCSSVMRNETTPEGIEFFCKTCEAFTEFDEMEMDPFCPDCGGAITIVATC